jgi:5S rRNA maturation endonuclease (ribonuclease M5)
MPSNSNWQRVSRRRPCPVCGRPDWCLYTGAHDAPTAAICARVESPKRCGEAGWLHRLRDDPLRPAARTRRVTVPTKTPPEKPILDFGAFARQCHLGCVPDVLRRFGGQLGVSALSLRRLCVGWSPRHGAWLFPMSDAAGNVVGIRLRLPNGRKLAVKGGREGLFLPSDLPDGRRLLVCEGPTDAAALLDLGFSAVGRPSCSGGTRHLVGLLRRLAVPEVVIVADADAPGQAGAERLAAALVAYCPAVKVITPPAPHKDARAWKKAGATAADVLALIDAAPVRTLAISARKAGSYVGP